MLPVAGSVARELKGDPLLHSVATEQGSGEVSVEGHHEVVVLGELLAHDPLELERLEATDGAGVSGHVEFEGLLGDDLVGEGLVVAVVVHGLSKEHLESA